MAQRLAVLRIHQRDAGLDVREQLALRVARARTDDLLVLATCHRVECYAAVPEGVEPRAWLLDRLELADDAGLVCETDEAAARHALRVACGLDSVIAGEGQIRLQLRRAYDAARAELHLDPLLTRLAQRSLQLSRNLRRETPLGQVGRSVGSLAVERGLALLDDPARAHAVIVGAGEIGRLAARALAQRAGRVTVANRDLPRAQALAREIGGTAVGLDDLGAALADADLVISAADSRGAVLTEELLRARLARGPLACVDIAVPRSVGPEARALAGLTYLDVDDLRPDDGPSPELLAEAERYCEDAATELVAETRSRAADPTIAGIHARAERVRRRQLERALARLGHLGERDREIVTALSHSLTKALLHQPTDALRADPADAPAARRLFGVDET